MSGLPLTTKILIVLIVVAGVRFFYTLSSRFQTPSQANVLSKQKIQAVGVEQILTCKQYTQQIKSCTSEAMVCLESIADSKKFHDENEHKILNCQAENEKNIQLNKQLRVKLDAVTERLEDLINRKKASQQQPQGSEL